MDNITIVGGGFSAAIASLLLDCPVKVITPQRLSEDEFPNLHRQRSLETNKLFSKQALSFSMLDFDLKHGRLNDRITHGGNSTIWGGFIDVGKLPSFFFNKLTTLGIVTKSLSFAVTGSQSNTSTLAQIQDKNGFIFESSRCLTNYNDGYLYSFLIEGDKIRLNVMNHGKLNIFYTKKLILAVGTVQLIDLLYRSNYLNENAVIQLSEFGYKLKLGFYLHPGKFSKRSTVIRFTFVRALFHYLGIQRASRICQWFSWIPLYVDQVFTHEKIKIPLKIQNGVMSDDELNGFKKYGGSIHYCNLKIDGRPINELLSEISSQVIGLGMPFVNQQMPGPISNDIVLDALNKLGQINDEK